MLRLTFFALILAVASGCSQFGGLADEQQAQQRWVDQQQNLAGFKRWDLRARAALKLEGEAYNIGILWQQGERDFKMRLEAPFGQGVFRIVSDNGERYRLLPPRPASLLDDDFLELIRALEQEFDRYRARTKEAGKVGRAILVHVTTGRRVEAEASMAELAELATSSDLQIVESIVQRRQSFDPRTLMGSGKLQDLIFDLVGGYVGPAIGGECGGQRQNGAHRTV